MERPLDVLRRWENHGAEYRVVHLDERRAVVDLCTCSGEPVDRLESEDRDLVRFLQRRATCTRYRR